MGCDRSVQSTQARAVCFNPRTHMGCDVKTEILSFCNICFNPRTHMGCDLMLLFLLTIFKVSIHAPTWGATQGSKLQALNQIVSIHAPTWGATQRSGIEHFEQ